MASGRSCAPTSSSRFAYGMSTAANAPPSASLAACATALYVSASESEWPRIAAIR